MEMRFKAVTVSTIGIPPMEFEFEQPSISQAMEFMCRGVPMMRGAPAYDFDLYCVPEANGEGGAVVKPPYELAPQHIGRTKTFVTTRFVKNAGLGSVLADSIPREKEMADA